MRISPLGPRGTSTGGTSTRATNGEPWKLRLIRLYKKPV